ncbi:MAG: MnmC family methyltransferase [Bdellovibrionia bacterium]
MSDFQLVTLKNGTQGVFSVQENEVFHPGIGPAQEAFELHVQQQRLTERVRQDRKFVIWDVGLGAAANALCAIDALLSLPDLSSTVEIHSFDRTLAPLEFAYEHAQELVYPVPHRGSIQALLSCGRVQITPQITWVLHLGDFAEQLRTALLPSAQAIFFDPYSPQKNPDLWSLDLFTLLKQKLDPQVGALLSTYTCSTAVRVSLLLAGFFVGLGVPVHTKRQTTLASTHLPLLPQALGASWLQTVARSSASAPIRMKLDSLGSRATLSEPISEEDFNRLRQCPQFKVELMSQK